jgi:hypothetical protein
VNRELKTSDAEMSSCENDGGTPGSNGNARDRESITEMMENMELIGDNGDHGDDGDAEWKMVKGLIVIWLREPRFQHRVNST